MAKFWTLWLFIGAIAGATHGCGGAKGELSAGQPTEPPRRQLQRNAARASSWRFVYCLTEDAAPDSLVRLLHDIADAQPYGKRVEVVNCQDLTTDTLGSGPVIVFGNRVPEGADRLPLQTTATGGWQLTGAPLTAPDDIIVLPSTRNPWTQSPTTAGFYLAQNPVRLAQRIRTEYEGNYNRMFWPGWAFEVYRADGSRTYGQYADTSWRFDPKQEITLTNPQTPVFDEGGLKVYAYDGSFNQADLQKTVKALLHLGRLYVRMLEGDSAPYPEVRLFPNVERIGLRTGRMNPVQFNQQRGVLNVVPSMIDYDELIVDFAAWNAMLAPLLPDGLTTAQLDRLVAALQLRVHEELGPQLARSFGLGARIKKYPYLFDQPEGDSQFLRHARLHYLVWLETSCVLSARELIATAAEPTPCIRAGLFDADLLLDRVPAPKTFMPAADLTLAGMTFAHEGYRVHNGYGGEKIVPSLDSLATLNVNAIAIVPYTFQRNPNQPAPYRIGEEAGQENDWAVIRSVREAQRRGWSVLLKPQIWVGGGNWPGSIDFDNEADWNAFFEHYTYWILHYALLAEREGIAALCLGTELVHTTLKHPDRWREIIRLVRQVYGGQLTYAANWGEEFEGFSFWKDLDAIGLNSYYPLSKASTPTDAELLAGAERWLAMAAAVSRRENRTLWLTEVGYRSVADTWRDPHAEPNDRPADFEAQARAFRALTTAAAATPELRGMFVWKWPSYLGRGSYRGKKVGFTPGGKPAEEELRRFYERFR